MVYQKLKNIEPLLFSYREVAKVLNIQLSSAKLLCHRYQKQKYFVRLKRDVYILAERWNYLSALELFQIANRLQVPSYISLTTALSYYGYSTQIQQGFFESVAIKRTWKRNIESTIFSYTRISDKYYFGFRRMNGIFIAEPEKALTDALYLTSIGRYGLDFSALEMSKIDLKIVDTLLNKYPEKTKSTWDNYARP